MTYEEERNQIELLWLWENHDFGDLDWTKGLTRKQWRYLRSLGCTRRYCRRERRNYKKWVRT